MTEKVANRSSYSTISFAAKVKNEMKQWKRNRYLLLMTIPAMLYYVLFCYAPMYGLVIGFKDFTMKFGLSFMENIANSPWVGLKHINDYANSMFFIRNLRNTFLLFLYQLAFGFPLPIMFSLLLNEIRNSGVKKIVQTVSYLPHFISVVAISSMLTMFLSTQSGFINTIIENLGFGPIAFLNDSKYFRTIYVASGIWQNLGWNSIVYLAAISTIDTSLYEAATVDGASRWQNMYYITLPSLLPTIATLLILNTGGVLNQGGEKVILLYSPATYETADVISSFIYRRGLQESNYSYATAVGLFVSIVNVVFLLGCNYITGKMTETSLF